MSVKCAYYLTDCTKPGGGQTWVVPGSMGQNGPGQLLPKSGVGQPEGAHPVLVPANSVMIFDRRLLHAQSPNYSQAERIVLFMGYGARWLKARDAMYVEPALERTRCPIARQMLGYTTQNSGLYHGNGLDVPLRAWLRSHDCNEGLGFQLAIADSDHRGSGHQPTSALDGEVGHATYPRNPDRLAWPIGDLDIDQWRLNRDVKLGLKDPAPVQPAVSPDAADEQIFADTRIADCAVDPELCLLRRKLM